MEILIVVDMQKDFITGCLGNESTRAVVEPVCDLITSFKNSNSGATQLIYTMDTHYNNYMDTMEGKKLPVLHCIEGTEGWNLDTSVKSAIGSDGIMVKKETFGAKALPEVINNILYVENKVDEPLKITLCGVCTDICVISNAMLLKANYPNAEIVINSKCCAGVTEERHNIALEAMKSCHIDII